MQKIAAAQQVRLLSALVPAYFRAHFAQIPSLSSRASFVLSQTLNADNLSTVQLGEMIRSDPPSAASLLHLANSPLYQRNQPISTLQEAIVRVGQKNVYAMLLALATRSLFEPSLRSLYALLPHHWYRLQCHAVVCGFGTAYLAESQNLQVGDLAFVAGMFLDIGKLGALYCVCGLIVDDQIDFEVTQASAAQVMEETHVEMGREMLSNWRLPEPIRSLCDSHHRTLLLTDPQAPLIHCMRIISSLDSLRDSTYTPPGADQALRESLGALQLEGPRLKEVAKQLQLITDNVKKLLGAPDVPASAPAV
jgi:HD-like signal output (HDOD) protein